MQKGRFVPNLNQISQSLQLLKRKEIEKNIKIIKENIENVGTIIGFDLIVPSLELTMMVTWIAESSYGSLLRTRSSEIAEQIRTTLLSIINFVMPTSSFTLREIVRPTQIGVSVSMMGVNESLDQVPC